MPKWIPIVVALGLMLVSVACDSRARSIRAELSPEEVQVFDLGARLSVECWSCHDFYSLEPKIGPGLHGLMGRRTGAAPGFGYSDAMQGANFVWDRAMLRAFLANSQAVVPGNRMVFRGVGGPGALDALVFYVEQATRPR